MSTFQSAFRALLAGVTLLGGPAAAAAQPVALPLAATRAFVVVDAWQGFSPVSPTRATYTLARAEDGSFRGTVEIRVGAGMVRRDTSFALHLPRSAADSLLSALSGVPVRAGEYRPRLLHTDDYPAITAEFAVGDSVVRFHTRSQGASHVPWQVSAAGATYVSESPAIWTALDAVLAFGRRAQRALVEAASRDPECRCGHSRRPSGAADAPVPRPRYAAGEAWFTRDSSITVQGRAYLKTGMPLILGLHEISPYATYEGVAVFRETGSQGTPEVLYVPVRASCEVQPYVIQPLP